MNIYKHLEKTFKNELDYFWKKFSFYCKFDGFIKG